MDFQTRKINEKPKDYSELIKAANKDIKSTNTLRKWFILGVLCAITISLLAYGVLSFFKDISFKKLFLSLGKELQSDSLNRTNFLLLGHGVQGVNDASDLTDTIILASYNHDTGKIAMLSLPRDLYVNNSITGKGRINQVYEFAAIQEGHQTGINAIEEEVEKITGMNIHYYAKVNFNGVKEIVDSLGGITVDVKESIYDPSYPKDGTLLYEPFRISKGIQTLDGETALKYARSRKTTSDFDRARRQQQIIYAMKEKAAKLEILGDATKVQELFNAVSDNLETDLSLREIIELARIGEEINKDQIASFVLNDDPNSCGGLLYTPPREDYDNASVLIPWSNNSKDRYSLTKNFANVVFNPYQLSKEIEIYNGTKLSGLAGDLSSKLSRFCFNVEKVTNAENRDHEFTEIHYQDENEPAEIKVIESLLDYPINIIPNQTSETNNPSSSPIEIILGEDYQELAKDDLIY